MKIGIDASFLRKPGTGIGQVTLNFIQKLRENFEFRISNFELPENSRFILYTEERVDFELPEGFEVKVFLPRWWKRDDVIRKMLWEKEVATRAESDGCDVFLSLYQSATIFHGAKKFQHIMVVHDVIPKLFPEYLNKWTRRMHWKKIEQGIRSADHIVAVSQSTKQDIISLLGASSEKITVASPGLSPVFDVRPNSETIDRILVQYGLEQQGYIYHGGGLEIRKNTESVLRAYKSLCDKFQISNFKFQNKSKNQNFKIPKLVISGKVHDRSNPLATDVMGLIRELHLEDSVFLLGFVPEEELPALYAGAMFFVFPSKYEGFGIPPLEAMYMECPVLVSRTSSLPEVCGDAALYCDLEEELSLSDAMLRMISDEALRADLRARGLIQSRMFSYDSFVENVFRVVQKDL